MGETEKIDWRVYLLRCRDGSFYCGATNDLNRRVKQHNAGSGSKYTKSRLPVKLIAKSGPMSRGEALSNEAIVKKQPRELKAAAVNGL